MNHLSLTEAISVERERILHHPLYDQLNNIEQLRSFSQFHVYAVWDFMSLLKSLQLDLTCVRLPWLPVGSASTRYLINEIVTGEESDVDQHGNRCSHFELYLKAMEEMSADTLPVLQLIALLQQGKTIAESFAALRLPEAVSRFCNFTFDVVDNAPIHVKAAVFTFGREDLIPGMFVKLVRRLNMHHPEQLNTFLYYLERHIEVDGDHHSKLALQMVEELCGNDPVKWQEATEACVRALAMRRGLWDGVADQLQNTNAIV